MITKLPTEWLIKYYPVDACTFHGARQTKAMVLDAARASLAKWTGILPENLKKYKMVQVRDSVETKRGLGMMILDSETCALCQLFSDENGKINCKKCPLYKAGMYCDDVDSPYRAAINWDGSAAETDVRPMVEALKKIVKRLSA
jgi:hypothetical protein